MLECLTLMLLRSVFPSMSMRGFFVRLSVDGASGAQGLPSGPTWASNRSSTRSLISSLADFRTPLIVDIRRASSYVRTPSSDA